MPEMLQNDPKQRRKSERAYYGGGTSFGVQFKAELIEPIQIALIDLGC